MIFDLFDMLHISNAQPAWIPYWQEDLDKLTNLERGSDLASDFFGKIDRTKCTPKIPRPHIIQVLGKIYSTRFLSPSDYALARELAIKYEAELFVLKINPDKYKCFDTSTEKILAEWNYWDKFVVGYNNEQRKYDFLAGVRGQEKGIERIIAATQKNMELAISKNESPERILQYKKTIEGYKKKIMKLYKSLPTNEDEIVRAIFRFR